MTHWPKTSIDVASCPVAKDDSTTDVSAVTKSSVDIMAGDSSTAYDYIEPSRMTSRSREASVIGNYYTVV